MTIQNYNIDVSQLLYREVLFVKNYFSSNMHKTKTNQYKDNFYQSRQWLDMISKREKIKNTNKIVLGISSSY